jgi:2-polyprenyl-3-methyl-5-hydroxy-6-metoxy-1,4-benzoquinol methylase
MHEAIDQIAPLAVAAELPSWCASGSRVLDVGAGTGRNAVFLADLGYEVDAIDASARALVELATRAGARGLSIRTELLDARSCDIEFSRYRAVLCTFVLHLLTSSQAEQLLDRARAQAAPGAIHVIAAITADGDFFEHCRPADRYYPQPDEIAARYRAYGWQVHRAWVERRDMAETHPDGRPMRNLVSFVIAGCR